MSLQLTLLAFVALMFALMGLGSLLRPNNVTSQFGIGELNVDGRNEVRAVYGGFGLAMAVILLIAVLRPQWSTGIILTVSIALVGMAAGRLISALVDQGFGRTPLIYLVVELVGAGLLLAAL